MRVTRREQGSQMAFLDVMACGLGAAILLFLIVKHHAGRAAEPVAEPVAAESGRLAALREDAAVLTARIEQARRQSRERQVQGTQADADRARLAELERALEQAASGNAALRREVESIEPAQADDVVEDRQSGEEQYLLGLKVEGPRIALLLDRSASMTDERLVDIVSRKIGPDAEKQQGPKWRRALRAARWLLHRLPKESQVAVIAFNDRAQSLHGGRWAGSRDAAALQGLFGELDGLVPTGATNLEAGLRAIGELSPPATDIYVVTDGLPTQNLSSSGLFSSGCAVKTGKVSGACRKELFYASLRRSAPPAGRTTSTSSCCRLKATRKRRRRTGGWTAQAGGLLLTPAKGWP